MLNGCDAQAVQWRGLARLGHVGAVSNYDILVVGGTQYSANQILDKTLVAKAKTAVYMNGNFKTPAYYVQPGQAIGKVWSYLKPSDSRGGKAALMFYNEKNQAYYVLDEQAIDTSSLKDQGALTVKQEVAIEKEKALRDNDPVGYYLKKYGLPALLIIGGIVIAGGIAKEAVKGAINKTTTSKTQD